ncbi:MAG: hypothetical protein GC190_06805 [Alphaproteobacteria bacterium]|nr:hypothetical protein [Alphaproteobacteria bacterium]
MAIPAEAFDFLQNLDTVWAIVAGAVLATAGGIAASQLEHRVDTSRSKRQAALFFGEIMAMLSIVVSSAERAKGIGDPFGPVTMRLLRTVRREIDVYDRNRERLFEIPDPALRARIHTVLLRATMGCEGTIEAATEATAIETELKLNPTMSDEQRCHLQARLADQTDRREGGFEFLVESAAQARNLTKELEPLAGVDFTTLARAVQSLQNGPVSPLEEEAPTARRALDLALSTTGEARANDNATS